ncbi:hypothetical protein ACLB2K_029636 [Fragaria x ananassa]
MATRSYVNTAMRPKLADVTNLPAPPPRNENHPETSMGDKDRDEQLTRERMALIKLVTERNKIIELSGAELQKLRVSIQKLQLQNWNLACSNSQMLAELNSKRDTVKTLQHELLCKEALLKAKNSEMQEKSEMKCQNVRSKFKEPDEVTLHEVDNDDKPRICNKRRATRSQSLGASAKCQKVEQSLTLQGKEEINCQTTGHQFMEGEKPALLEATKDEKPCVGNKRNATRSQSMGASTTGQNNEQKDKVENKRRSLRRQSSRFKSDKEEQRETLFEIEEAKFPENRMLEDDPIPSISSTKQEEKEDSWAAKSEGVSQRCSVGRPMRKVVEKVQSYKEPPLHVKMRRAE